MDAVEGLAEVVGKGAGDGDGVPSGLDLNSGVAASALLPAAYDF